jgi:hypothetical protein
MAICRRPGRTSERFAYGNKKPGNFAGFFIAENGPPAFFHYRGITAFSGKTLPLEQAGRNGDANYRNSKKINFFNNLGRRNSSFCGKNSFLDL